MHRPRGRATDRERRGATVVVYTFFLERESFRAGYSADVRGYSAGRPGPDLGQALETLEHKHSGADIHDPNARTSMIPGDAKKIRAEKLWVDFRSLISEDFSRESTRKVNFAKKKKKKKQR